MARRTSTSTVAELQIGCVPDPKGWDRWPEAEAMLEGARDYDNDRKPILRPHFTVWAVLDGDELLAAATARLAGELCEIVLCGGRDHRRWVRQLSERIGSAAAEAGATQIAIIGRAGWAKSLKALGWASEGDGRIRVFRRALES
jgi:hypothetical protein